MTPITVVVIFYKDAQDTIVRDQCEELVRTGELARLETGFEHWKNVTDAFKGEATDISTGPGWMALKFASGKELTVDPKSNDYTILSEMNPEAGS